jgi:A/G-specific adenine glycosylase
MDIQEPLLTWYQQNKRTLPWRSDPTPYHVWVSEIMLQQTRVEAVKPYYERFLHELPSISDLARAQDELLLKLWEGLGYYNRVRNMKRAAIQIMEHYQGEMPDQYEALLELHGIGTYTAGAIVSIAFQKPYPAVDGNVLRVLSRLRMDTQPIQDLKVKTSIEKELRGVIPLDQPGAFNQGMMDIGAGICLPHGAPRCQICPFQQCCLAHLAGQERDFPVKAAKRPRTVSNRTVLIVKQAGRIVLNKRPLQGLMGGMYEFPNIEGFYTEDQVKAYLEEHGIYILDIKPGEQAKHIFTHLEWHMISYIITADVPIYPKEINVTHQPSPSSMPKTWIFADPSDIRQNIPIPSAFSAFMKYMP